MAQGAAPDSVVRHTLPVIDPRSLTRGQLAGDRCAIPNCGRRLAPPAYGVGHLPDGQLVLACAECASGVIRYERTEEFVVQAA